MTDREFIVMQERINVACVLVNSLMKRGCDSYDTAIDDTVSLLELDIESADRLRDMFTPKEVSEYDMGVEEGKKNQLFDDANKIIASLMASGCDDYETAIAEAESFLKLDEHTVIRLKELYKIKPESEW